MEGTRAIIVEMGTNTKPVVTPSLEGEVSVQIAQKGVTQPTTPTEEGFVKDFLTRTTKPFLPGVPSTEQTQSPGENKSSDAEKTPEELIAEKKQQLREHFEKFGEHLTAEEKAKLMKEFLEDYLTEGNDQNEDTKIEDTFAELARLVMLIFALLRLLASSDGTKNTFTGKDLYLPETPPEGKETNVLTKLLTGQDPQDSWKAFRDEVADMKEEIPFGEFMYLVLAANERNSTRKFKLKNKTGDKNTALPVKQNENGFWKRGISFAKRIIPTRKP